MAEKLTPDQVLSIVENEAIVDSYSRALRYGLLLTEALPDTDDDVARVGGLLFIAACCLQWSGAPLDESDFLSYASQMYRLAKEKQL